MAQIALEESVVATYFFHFQSDDLKLLRIDKRLAQGISIHKVRRNPEGG
jgi:hypothetical protein